MFKRFAPWMLIGLIAYGILSLPIVENFVSLLGDDESLIKAIASMAVIAFAVAREKE